MESLVSYINSWKQFFLKLQLKYQILIVASTSVIILGTFSLFLALFKGNPRQADNLKIKTSEKKAILKTTETSKVSDDNFSNLMRITKSNNSKDKNKVKSSRADNFLLASDISDYISNANGSNEFEKTIVGLAAFTDDLYDYYIKNFQSKSIKAKYFETKEAVQILGKMKYNCATRKILDAFNAAMDEGNANARRNKIGTLKTHLRTGWAELHNQFLALNKTHIRNIETTSLRLHTDSELKEIEETLIRMIQKAKDM